MLGFSFYQFEGIGTLMTILAEAGNPKRFEGNLKSTLISLSIYWTIFGFICYRYLGTQDNAVVIEAMHIQPEKVASIIQILYCINLVFTYPLVIYPTNQIIESWIFSKYNESMIIKNRIKKVIVILNCTLACIFAICFNMEVFLGVTGGMIGTIVILIIPTLCHYSLLARNPLEKRIDIVILLVSVVIFVLCTIDGFRGKLTD